MRSIFSRLGLLAALACLLGACGTFPGPKPAPKPRPSPTPTPEPTPTPQPTPQPTPEPTPLPGRVITEQEFDGVVIGSTSAALEAAFGKAPVDNEVVAGTRGWVYESTKKDAKGHPYYAEFWVRGGKVVNKNLL